MNQRYSEETLKNMLGKELESSSIIDKRIKEAYSVIRQSDKANKNSKTRKSIRRTLVSLASVAAVMVLLLIFCVSNPVWAAKLPIIGDIFKKVEKDVTYKGEYSKKSTQLEEDKKYVQESSGIKVTVTETYYESLALYLAVAIVNNEGFPEELIHPKNKKGDTLECNGLKLDTATVYDFTASGGKKSSSVTGGGTPDIVEGKFTDNHTFVGIIRVDMAALEYWPTEEELEQAGIFEKADAGWSFADVTTDIFPDAGTYLEIPDEFSFCLSIRDIYADLVETDKCETPIQKHYKGEWNFNLDVKVDTIDRQVVEINSENEQGIGSVKVTKTSEQISVDIFNEKGKVEDKYIAAICDAQGEILEPKDGIILGSYSTYGRDTSKVTVYICDWRTYMDEIAGVNINENLKEKVLYQQEITFK